MNENFEKSSNKKPTRVSRRQFLRAGLAAGVGFALAGSAEAQNIHEEKTKGIPEVSKEVRQKVEKLKAYLESPKIKALRESINKKIKPVLLSLSNEIDRMLDPLLEDKERECLKLKQGLLETGLTPELRKAMTNLLSSYQEDVVKEYHNLANIYDALIDKRSVEQNALLRKTRPKISGFDESGVITNDTFTSVVFNLPEKLWSDVAEIKFNNNTKSNTAAEAENYSESFGDALFTPKSRKSITFYDFYGMIQEKQEGIIERLAHELGHHIDWRNSINLTLEERLEFNNEIIDIFFDPKRSHDWYVDDYIPKQYDEMDTKNLGDYKIDDQVRELWAQLVARYFTEYVRKMPRAEDRLTEKERKFTKKWLAKNGIEFK